MPSLDAPGDALTAAVRARSFLHLLDTGRPVPVVALGTPAGRTAAEVRRVVDALAGSGRLTLTEDRGAVTGSLGLSVVPTRHRLDLHRGTYHTWCALDAVGILGALGATGRITSTTPTGLPVAVDFADGEPTGPPGPVLLLPERGTGPPVTTWCPLVNFFTDLDQARAWSAARGLTASVVPLREATSFGAGLWREAIAAADDLGPWHPPGGPHPTRVPTRPPSHPLPPHPLPPRPFPRP
ncbi:organomercurial lyase [Saccharothrix syringae]|nr:organomercurial lyase [Saccharothrix syringae]